MTNLLESSGYFWLHGTRIPKGRLGPNNAVAGNLIIDENGTAKLELHGLLTSQPDDLAGILEPYKRFQSDVLVHGILKGSTSRVLLKRIKRDGTSNSMVGGISFERLVAQECLVSRGHRDRQIDPDAFTSMSIDISSLEEWIGPKTIRVTKTQTGYSAIFTESMCRSFETNMGKIRIQHSVLPPQDRVFEGAHHRVEIRQVSTIDTLHSRGQALDVHLAQFRLTDDLLFLLVGQEAALDWPVLTGSKDNIGCRYYFSRQQRRALSSPLKWTDCWTSFKSTEENFGDLFTTFVRKREEFGPGIYLYLGTRRATKLYPENRFANFIWGLESLHRRSAQEGASNALEAKIARIVAQIERGSDRRWLASKLRNAAEPSLADRLFAIFDALPLNIERQSLCDFCKDCADRRNDISHFGGHRQESHDDNYTAFVGHLIVLSDAIELLYHAMLLQQVGVENHHLRQWLLNGPKSYGYKVVLEAAGLRFNA